MPSIRPSTAEVIREDSDVHASQGPGALQTAETRGEINSEVATAAFEHSKEGQEQIATISKLAAEMLKGIFNSSAPTANDIESK
jgi:hypothetical protein